jgi:hypothetical protein
MNLAQKIAACVTLLVIAAFLFAGGHQTGSWERDWDGNISPDSVYYSHMDIGRTAMDAIGILLVGGVATILLGIKRARKK